MDRIDQAVMGLLIIIFFLLGMFVGHNIKVPNNFKVERILTDCELIWRGGDYQINCELKKKEVYIPDAYDG